jgi:hypothetical protein
MTPDLRRMPRFALSAIFLIATLAYAQDSGREFHWSGKLAPEQIVQIKNVSGRIDASPASGDQIEVSAEKSGHDAEKIRVEVVPSSEGVTICAIYPGGDFGASSGPCEPGDNWHSNSHGNNNARVDFTVKVPENIRFYAQSVNGPVKAEDMGRFVKASSVNGSVRVTTKAWAQMESVNGSLEGSFGRADWNGTLKLETVNGSIDLDLPADISTDIRFSSVNGRLNSDFPITMQGSMSSRKVHGTIGNGGRELEIETVNGSARLKKGGI